MKNAKRRAGRGHYQVECRRVEERKRRAREEKAARKANRAAARAAKEKLGIVLSCRIERRNDEERDERVTRLYGPLGHVSCGRKSRYVSHKVASSVARYRMEENPMVPLFVYHCLCCDGWHITHRQMTRGEVADQVRRMREHRDAVEAAVGDAS